MYSFLQLMAFTLFLSCFSHAEAHSLRPVPWITHEAVCFLDEYMKTHPDARVLEFGSGSSTIWFAKRTKNLFSLEHSPEWYKMMLEILAAEPDCNYAHLILHERPYWTVCNFFKDESFDLILVDGRNRSGCIKESIRILKKGGVLMLDNAERQYYKKALDLLEGWEAVKTTQIEPDSCGFTYPNWQTHWYIKP